MEFSIEMKYVLDSFWLLISGCLVMWMAAGFAMLEAGLVRTKNTTAILIGAIGGLLVVFAIPMFDKFKIDDPVGALSVHLVNGIWGTLAVGIFNPDVALFAQVKGIVVIGAFTFFSSLLVWAILKYSVGIGVSEEEEYNGMDVCEFGLHAYPEFVERQGA